MHDPLELLWSIKRPPATPREWRRSRWPLLLDVWHREPNGRDSGTVCARKSRGLHLHHWHLRFWPMFNFRMRFKRCAECGRRMNTATRFGYMGTDRTWHYECQGYAEAQKSRLLLSEVLDRLFVHWGIESRDDLHAVVIRPDERRDQFLLSYRPWEMVERYRATSPDKRWRAPNERAEHNTEGTSLAGAEPS